MTLDELRQKWGSRRDEWRRLGVRVDGALLADELLADLRELVDADLVTLREASRIGGYSVEHLQRLVAAGEIANQGRRYRPRIRRVDVPVKPGHSAAPLPDPAAGDLFSARRRIVAAARTQRDA